MIPAWLVDYLRRQEPLHIEELPQLEDPTVERLRRQHERDRQAEDDGNATVIHIPGDDCPE